MMTTILPTGRTHRAVSPASRTRAVALLVGVVFGAVAARDAVAGKVTVKKGGAFSTIQAGVDGASAGDTISVKSGVYQENVVIPIGKNGLSIVGDGKVTLEARPAGGVGVGAGIDVFANDVTLQKLTLRNADSGISAGDGIRGNGSGLTVKSCEILLNSGVGVFAGADTTVTKSTFSGNATAIFFIGDGGVVTKCTIDGDGEQGILIIGNNARIASNKIFAIEDNHGINVSGSDIVIEDNEIVNVNGHGVFASGNNVEVINNQIRRCNGHGISIVGSLAQVSGNKVQRVDGGIRVNGNDGKVAKNDVTFALSQGIFADGDDVEITKNDVRYARLQGIVVEGDRGEITKNSVEETVLGGIDLAGADGVITKNDVVGAGEALIGVSGNNPTVSFNKVEDAIDDAVGIRIEGAVNGGTLEGNEVSRAVCTGIALDPACVGLSLLANVVRHCGAEEEPGFQILGQGHLLVDNRAECNGGDGFNVQADNVMLIDNIATDNLLDGFDIDGTTPTGNSLDGNKAIGNGGEGIENNGANTSITGNVAKQNRIDFANDGTVTTFSGNTSGDGSDDTTPPEMDT